MWDLSNAPIWAMYPHSEQTLIGVELPVDVIIEYEDDFVRECEKNGTLIGPAKLRYKGKMDGLHQLKNGETRAEENKTTSRITDAWIGQFETSHQITGYCKAMQIQYDVVCDKAKLHGLAIPLPRTYDYGGVIDQPLTRKPHQYDSWLRWVLHTYETRIKPNLDKPEEATTNTGKCYDYFRLCEFLPMCAGMDEEERKHCIEEELESYEWDPEYS